MNKEEMTEEEKRILTAIYISGLLDAAELCRQEAKRQFPIRRWRWVKGRGLYHTFSAGRRERAKAAIRCARLIDRAAKEVK